MRKLAKICAIAILAGLLFPAPSFGMMSSSNYTIFADSVDSGGIFSSGGAYSLEDTTGESPAGFTTSSIYEVRGGYQAMDWATLSLNLSTTTINIFIDAGDTATIGTGYTTSTITTDADTGYNFAITDVTGTHLADVTDGSVSGTGVEEYGLALSGVDRLYTDDQAVTSILNLSASSSIVTDVETVLIFKACVSTATTIGTRTQTITATASANI
jgi:hypothetical protein